MRTPCRSIAVSQEATKTFMLSTTSKTRNLKLTTKDSDFANTCISLTKEFEAMSSPVKSSLPTRGQNTTLRIVTTGVQPNRNTATPLRVPSSFAVSDVKNNHSVSSPATFQCQNSLNEPSRCTARKTTPHPKVCWTDKPVEMECVSPEQAQISTTPMKEINTLNLSGIQPLKETPAEKDQRNMSSQVLVPMWILLNKLIPYFHDFKNAGP